MFSKELFEELDPIQKINMAAFFKTDYFQKFADMHIQMYGLQLTTLDPDTPNFVNEFKVAQTHLRSWQALLQFINEINLEEYQQ